MKLFLHVIRRSWHVWWANHYYQLWQENLRNGLIHAARYRWKKYCLHLCALKALS